MTDIEQYQEIGRVVSEHKDAKRKFNCHRGKARLLGRQLRRLAEVIESIGDDGSVPIKTEDSLVVSETETVGVPGRDEVFSVFDGVVAACAEWKALDEQRRDLEID